MSRAAPPCLDVGAAVGGGGVHVQVAAKVLRGDETGQGAGFGGGDLSAVLAQFRRHVGELERLVDAFLGLAGHQVSSATRKGRIRSA